MNDDYPGWLLDLVIKLVEFEEGHPSLFEKGSRVSYNKPVAGEPRFTHETGYLVGEQWKCFNDDVTTKIPADVITAATWYQKGKEAGRREQVEQGQESTQDGAVRGAV